MWDHTIKWLNETDTRSYEDSGTWGNYGNNMKTVRSGGTSPAMTGGIETITYEGKTYSNSPTSSNNIFDLAGNVWEWTRSKDTAFTRMARGASYNQNSNGYRAYSNISNNVNYTYYDYGARGILLIKY